MKRITTLTGPSCAGKSTLEGLMVEEGCLKAVSTTTRAPRAGEKEGVDYYFIDNSKFKRLQAQGAFIESVQFGEHWYGVTGHEVERLFALGDHVVLVCEPVGAKQIALYCKHWRDIILTSVFVDNPDVVIGERFLTRFYNDLREVVDLGVGQAGHRRVLASYAKRMAMIAGVERSWVAEAYGHAHPSYRESDNSAFHYDILVESFGEENRDAVVRMLISPNPVLA